MNWHNVDARTEEGRIEWDMLRLGKFGSSEFSKVITPKTLKISSQAPGLLNRILAERITGMPVENFSSEWMDRGVELEDQAVRAYESITDTETTIGGIFIADDGVLCCSPDRLVGKDGDLEIKCPLIQTQVGYALNGLDDEYKLQLQGRMMLHGRAWVDIFAYHPLLSIPPLRVMRDDKLIAIMRPVIETFRDQVLEFQLKLERQFGPFKRPEPAPAPDYTADMPTHADVDALYEMGAIRPGARE